MRTNSEIREAARTELNENWGSAAVLTLVSFIFYGVASTISGLTILLLPMSWAYSIAYLSHHRGESNAFDISHLFDGYTKGQFGRVFITQSLVIIYTFLWVLLLIIPGIIKSIAYSMTEFILKDRPDLKNNEAINLSQAMMQGHKWDYFCLQLSFLGWILLSILTLGIGMLWVTPYMSAANAIFYEDLKREFENGGRVYEDNHSTESTPTEDSTDNYIKDTTDNYNKNI